MATVSENTILGSSLIATGMGFSESGGCTFFGCGCGSSIDLATGTGGFVDCAWQKQIAPQIIKMNDPIVDPLTTCMIFSLKELSFPAKLVISDIMKYFKVILFDNYCVFDKVEDALDEIRTNLTETDEPISIQAIEMTEDEFNALPEFSGY